MAPPIPDSNQPSRPSPPIPAADQDWSRRPGVPRERPPEPWPNSRPQIARMTARPNTRPHGRPGKQMPPVYSTALPLRGLSGLLRRAAYRLPDHATNHWTLLLFADRVESWGRRTRKLFWFAAPVALGAIVLRRAFADR